MRESTRRKFLRASAATVPLVGVGTSPAAVAREWQPAQDTSTGEIPAYADWVPAGEIMLDEGGEITFGSFDVSALLEMIALGEQEESESPGEDEQSLPFEAFFFATLLAAFEWSALDEAELSEVILGQTSEQAIENPETADPPAERHTAVGNTSIYTGSFDTATLESKVESGPFEETDQEGVYVFESLTAGEQYLQWGENYVVLSARQEGLRAIVAAGTGEQPRYHEENEDFGRLLASGGSGDFTFARLATAEALVLETEEDDLFNLGYAPLEGSQGYIHSNWFDTDEERFEAVSVVSYANEDRVEMDRLEGVGASASEQNITQNGRFVTIETSYEETAFVTDSSDGNETDDASNETDSSDESGDDETDDASNETDSSDESGDDETNGDDETDGGDETDETSTEGGDDGEEPANVTDDADDDGAGFGVLATLSSIGGTGYLLSRRFGVDE